MPAKKGRNKINLLIREGLAATTSGRVIAWIISTFRVMVIITELIVMVAFLSRFWFDAQNTDLGDEIKEKQAIIASFSDFENEFKEIQTRLKVFSELTANEGLVANSIKTTTSSLPPDVFLNLLSFSQNIITIEGTSPSEKSIQQLIVNLDSKDIFKTANLTEMGTVVNDPNLFKFKIAVLFEGKD
jgi:Tfp pilus assembly protein PilN